MKQTSLLSCDVFMQLDQGAILLKNNKRMLYALGALATSITFAGCSALPMPTLIPAHDTSFLKNADGTIRSEIPAIADPAGETLKLTNSQADEFMKHSTPIDTEDVVFKNNEDLSVSEVEERTLQMADDYEVGDPLSPEDLEFFRAYLLREDASDVGPQAVTAGFAASNEGNATDNSPSYIAPALAKTISINRSKTALSSSVSQVGSLKLKVTEPGPFDNSWSTNFTAKRTAGKSLTKIKCQIKVQAYGAVTAWPFVGKIADISRSSTSPANAQSWSFSRSEPVSGALLGMEAQTYAYFWNSSGSFQLP